MIGRFIFECDTDHFDVACDAAKCLLDMPSEKSVATSASDADGGNAVMMVAARLKKSIRVRQVRP
jgi:hypothetical protein